MNTEPTTPGRAGRCGPGRADSCSVLSSAPPALAGLPFVLDHPHVFLRARRLPLATGTLRPVPAHRARVEGGTPAELYRRREPAATVDAPDLLRHRPLGSVGFSDLSSSNCHLPSDQR